jgi:hypothetical protein
VCVLILTGCSVAHSTRKGKNYENTITPYGDDVYYKTYADLCAASDMIFYGTVKSVKTTVVNEVVVTDRPKVNDIGSCYEVKITEYMKGELEPNDTITIYQIGGIYKNVKYKPDYGENLVTGKEYVFFVNKHNDGSYTEVTPFQGHIKIVKGHCSPSAKMAWNDMEYLISNGTSYENLVAYLKKYT